MLRRGSRIIHRLHVVAFCAVTCFGFLATPHPIAAVGTLDYARDSVSTNTAGRSEVTHVIEFSLPITSQPVTPSDWIIINFFNYSYVTPANQVEGAFGTPIFYLDNAKVKINNISLLPGSSIKISGITAQNPPIGLNPQVNIKIAADAAGTQVKNEATITEPIQGANVTRVSATVEAPISGLHIAGFTAPGSFVTLTENEAVIGTDISIFNGSFSFSITGMSDGTHSFRISASDPRNLSTSQASLLLDLSSGYFTSVEDILLSPTIQLDKSEIHPGDELTLSGGAKPNSQINIFVESPLRTYSVATDANGDWEYLIPSNETASYLPGQYRVYANVQDTTGNQSLASLTVNFLVTNLDNGNNPPPDCDISKGDLNCDGKTNLTDFSILLFHWKTNHKVADINGDNIVNLTDFSIMMFYFRR